MKRRSWEKQEEDLSRARVCQNEFERSQVRILGELIDNKEKRPVLSQKEYSVIYETSC